MKKFKSNKYFLLAGFSLFLIVILLIALPISKKYIFSKPITSSSFSDATVMKKPSSSFTNALPYFASSSVESSLPLSEKDRKEPKVNNIIFAPFSSKEVTISEDGNLYVSGSCTDQKEIIFSMLLDDRHFDFSDSVICRDNKFILATLPVQSMLEGLDWYEAKDNFKVSLFASYLEDRYISKPLEINLNKYFSSLNNFVSFETSSPLTMDNENYLLTLSGKCHTLPLDSFILEEVIRGEVVNQKEIYCSQTASGKGYYFLEEVEIISLLTGINTVELRVKTAKGKLISQPFSLKINYIDYRLYSFEVSSIEDQELISQTSVFRGKCFPGNEISIFIDGGYIETSELISGSGSALCDDKGTFYLKVDYSTISLIYPEIPVNIEAFQDDGENIESLSYQNLSFIITE